MISNLATLFLGYIRDLGRKLGTEINEAREEVTVWQEQTGGNHRIPEGRSGIAIVRALTQRVLDFKADGTGYDYPSTGPSLIYTIGATRHEGP
jgi:hypothetical protein